MRQSGILWLLLGLVLWSSCRSDFDTVISTGNLEFSRDTVYLDTIFTNIGSSTYTLKVYNRGNEDLTIPRVELKLGEESRYRLNVDGLPGKSFDNIEILAKDSIYIFIETTVDYAETPATEKQFLYVDAITFSSASHSQEVPLITLVKDAVFLYPKRYSDGTYERISFRTNEEDASRVWGFYLEENDLEFTAEKPYVIYGYAAVPEGKTLKIHPGARIHFHAESGLIASKGSSIISEGGFSQNRELLEKEIIFEGDRLEPGYSNIPGQWGTILLTKGSREHRFSYTTIKNASIGLLVDSGSAPLFLANTQIYNSASSGIFASNAYIEGENLVINNSGQASLQLVQGGTYRFKHSTITNYWQNGFRQFPAVYISNSGSSNGEPSAADLSAEFSNSIIYGNQASELLYSVDETAGFDIIFRNSVIRFSTNGNSSSGNPLYDFSNPEFYQEVILNEDPLFVAPHNNRLQLSEGSPIRDRGNLSTALTVPFDLLQNSRTSSPDPGAYEWTPPAEGEQEN